MNSHVLKNVWPQFQSGRRTCGFIDFANNFLSFFFESVVFDYVYFLNE